MKKLLFTVLTILFSIGAIAQPADLTINNLSSPCAIYVVMNAVDGSCSNGTQCDLKSNGFSVPAFSSVNFTSVADFTIQVGWASTLGGPYGLNCAYTTTAFQWTDIEFTINCNSSTCGSPGGPHYMSDDALALCGSGQSCHNAAQTWVSPVPGSCLNNGSWTPPSGCLLGSVVIDFW